MNKLPNELLDIIWNHYWEFKYSEEVVKEISLPNNEINKILLFLRNHFIHNKNEIYDKQITHYLEKYNYSLLEINKNKGLRLLYKLNHPLLQYCFDEEYWQSCFLNVRDELKAITIFTIIFNNPELRYKLLYRFTKL